MSVSDEMTLAEQLPQADASSLVDRDRLEAEVKDTYRLVASERYGSAIRPTCSTPSPPRRSRPSQGVGYHLDLAGLAPGERVLDELPLEDASFDVVISNGVINLSPVKHRVFAEAARVLRPGGRLALADIVSARALKERTRRNVDLWAACIAGAIPRHSYVAAIETAGFRVEKIRTNDYEFMSERALDACSTYGVDSISLSAVKVP